MVTVTLDDDLVAAMEAEGEALDRRARELIVVELYRRDAISGGKAAELLGMSHRAFIQFSGELGIPYGNLSAEDVTGEVRTAGEHVTR